MASTSGSADATGVTFRLADRPRRLAAVRLAHELGGGPIDLERAAGEWTLRLDQPPVDRMEYLFELQDHNANPWTIPDPGNPKRAPGAFGEKSVVEFESYRPPGWLDAPEPDAVTDTVEVDVLDTTMTVQLWEPAGCAGPAPLLAVHDGPEYAELGGFTRWLGAMIDAGELPPTRAALLDPGDRNAWYSANPDYARALAEDVLPKLRPTSVTVGVGASLGAVAMLHAHRTRPGTFGALFLQSGSFFTPELDPQESEFSGFEPVTAFVEQTHADASDPDPVPTVLTCGTVEENLADNRAMAETLSRLGYGAELHERADAHNFTAWRDALHPYLTELVARAA